MRNDNCGMSKKNAYSENAPEKSVVKREKSGNGFHFSIGLGGS